MAPLATAEQFRTYCQTTPVTLTDEQILAVPFYLDGVSGDIRSYCGWSISAEDGAEWTLDGDGSEVLGVPSLHLRAVTSVQADVTALNVTDELEWSEAGYLLNRNRWPRKLRSVVVVGDHGYEPVPAEIVTVTCSMASRLASTAGQGGASSVRIGDYAETRPGTNVLTGAVGADMLGASPTEQAILDRYRIALRS